ncbi:rhodanese-like domain-containing protein, partial [Acinetobacter baumannii]
MKSITVQQLHEQSDVPLVDVREVDEFTAGHVPGAVNIPLST